MNSLNKICCCLVAGAALSASAVSVKVDQVRQRYPWNGLVDIDYTIVNDGAPLGLDDNIEVTMVDKSVDPAVTNCAHVFLQSPLPMAAGSHRITWDANKDGVTNRTDQAEFHLKIVRYSEAYMVIDVSKGSTAEYFPVDFLNGAPLGGFNVDEYKGNKIVLRRIRPGTYMAGSPSTEAARFSGREDQHRVTLTRPFYIGVFEFTKLQYQNVKGGSTVAANDFTPVSTMTYTDIRGDGWPTTLEPAANSFMDKLTKKCKARDSSGNYTLDMTAFDIPTEFQWEYACRAGTTHALNTTNEFNNSNYSQIEEQLKSLGSYKSNPGSIVNVGSYEPNQWGLYDMHGNVTEWCRDYWFEVPAKLNQYVDPVGPSSGPNRVSRGGGYSDSAQLCRSAFRNVNQPSSKFGFRLCWTMP